jgi:hypothetical protein
MFLLRNPRNNLRDKKLRNRELRSRPLRRTSQVG